MIRPKLVVVNSDRDEQSRSVREGKGMRFELSRSRVVAYALGLVMSLCFMFTLGVFVGRGSAIVRSDDLTVKGRFLRFLGLQRQTEAPVAKASLTWEDPKKMLESLDYYQGLTKQTRSPLAPLSQKAQQSPASASAQSATAKEAKANPATAPAPAAGKPAEKQPVKPFPTAPPAGRYTLLVASLKEHDAQSLVDKLRADGYSPFVESLEFGSSKWSRILLGSFETRSAAIAFADKFNRKEKTEAMVISGKK
ncbi:MAG: SPOR domain-containing protein [Syntrophobacteraceae bacterium]|nr:SPOR domain-containing protein [Syntrophobacteraceae bacterium]